MENVVNHGLWVMKKILLFAIPVLFLAACQTNYPTKAFEGLWEPIGYEDCDIFVISSDSIKAIQSNTKQEHYQCHYKVLRDSIVELERTWMWKLADGVVLKPSDVTSEAYMYIDKEQHLIIKYFLPESELSQNYPNYTHLKLKRLKSAQGIEVR